MAEPISIQQLKDASEDAISLAEFINKPENVMIPRRLSSDIHSLQYYLEYMKSFAQRSYETYDEMVANASNLSENVSVFVTNDSDTSKNGIYTYNGTSFVKGEYQPENAAKEFVESKLGGLEVFDGKVRAQDVSTVDGSTQDVKNTEFRTELDALPFEGGVLADTFVTVTANEVGSVARSQHDVNSDTISLKDFGSYANGADWTDAFHKAVATGKLITLPQGKYGLRTDAFDCQGIDLRLQSDGAEIELLAGSGVAAFDVTNCKRVEANGITFIAPSGNRVIFTVSDTSLVDLFSMTNCKSVGAVSVFRKSGSKTQDPFVTPFGFKRFIYNDNKTENTSARYLILTNFPIYYSEFKRNDIHNFSSTFCGFGIDNTAANKEQIAKITSSVWQDNHAYNDDDYWNQDLSRNYYTLLLIEGKSAHWINNTVEGMKGDYAGLPLYDAYLHCSSVVRKNSIWKNNANFNADNSGNVVIHAKMDSTAEVRANKVFQGNSFVIEDAWLKRIGKTSCSHKLWSLGDNNAGDVILQGNTFDIYTVVNSNRKSIESMVFKDNTIKAKKSYELLPLLAFNAVVAGESTMDIFNNVFDVKDATEGAIILLNSYPDTTWGSVRMGSNQVTVQESRVSGDYLMYEVNSKSLQMHNNTFDMALGAEFFTCNFGSISADNNTYLKAISSGAKPLSGLKINGKGSLTNSYVGLVSTIRFEVHTDPLRPPATKDTAYVCRVVVDGVTGRNAIMFKYTLEHIDGVYKIKFIDSTDVEKTAQVLTTQESSSVLKSTLSGDGDLVLSVRLLNRDYGTEFDIVGLPVTSCNYRVSIDSF